MFPSSELHPNPTGVGVMDTSAFRRPFSRRTLLGLMGAVAAAVAVDFGGGHDRAEAAAANWEAPPPYAAILGVI